MAAPDATTSKSLEWKPEYDELLDHIATTNLFESDWGELKSVLKHKITVNIDQILTDTNAPRPPTPLRPQTPPSSGSTAVVGPPTPPLTLKGLIIPPFPLRNPMDEYSIKALPTNMSKSDAHGFKDRVFSMLDGFDKPPFTIQRLCELAVHPREHYSVVGKYLRALERTLLVTSTWDEYIINTYAHEQNTPWAMASNEALMHATTPIFSPIPFLANSRSASRSPPHLALEGDRSGDDPGDENTPPRGMSMAKIRTLKVDELDHTDGVEAYSRATRTASARAHLAEHPEAFSAAAASGIGSSSESGGGSPASTRASSGSLVDDKSPPPLSDRFVRSSTPEPSPTRALEENKREAAAAAASSDGSIGGPAEEGEVEDVVMNTS